MTKFILLTFLCACACACALSAEAGFYAEAGVFYTSRPSYEYTITIDDEGTPAEERDYSSHAIAEVSLGYKHRIYRSSNMTASMILELKHNSDPFRSGSDDRFARNILGVKTRIEF